MDEHRCRRHHVTLQSRKFEVPGRICSELDRCRVAPCPESSRGWINFGQVGTELGQLRPDLPRDRPNLIRTQHNLGRTGPMLPGFGQAQADLGRISADVRQLPEAHSGRHPQLPKENICVFLVRCGGAVRTTDPRFRSMFLFRNTARTRACDVGRLCTVLGENWCRRYCAPRRMPAMRAHISRTQVSGARVPMATFQSASLR